MEKEKKEKQDASAEKQQGSGKKDRNETPPEHMTMSQRQNRFGEGREQNGSDGTRQGGFSKH
ncbi:MAG: hypothetical protein ACO1OO_03120 [Flavisolibacter sp.]